MRRLRRLRRRKRRSRRDWSFFFFPSSPSFNRCRYLRFVDWIALAFRWISASYPIKSSGGESRWSFSAFFILPEYVSGLYNASLKLCTRP